MSALWDLSDAVSRRSLVPSLLKQLFWEAGRSSPDLPSRLPAPRAARRWEQKTFLRCVVALKKKNKLTTLNLGQSQPSKGYSLASSPRSRRTDFSLSDWDFRSDRRRHPLGNQVHGGAPWLTGAAPPGRGLLPQRGLPQVAHFMGSPFHLSLWDPARFPSSSDRRLISCVGPCLVSRILAQTALLAAALFRCRCGAWSGRLGITLTVPD